jgi:hypothetical protein
MWFYAVKCCALHERSYSVCMNTYTVPSLVLALSAVAFGAVGCADSDADVGPSDSNLSSVHARQVAATVTDGLVVGVDVAESAPDFRAQVEAIVRAQLQYSVGFLNGRSGAPSLRRTVVKNVVRVGPAGAGLAQYRYSAELDVMLGRSPENDAATSIDLLLPAQVDTAFLTSFVSRFKTDCVSNLRDKPTVDTYWYYYRPEAFFCPLTKTPKPADLAAVQRITAKLSAKPEGPVTYPEYDAVWKDGKFMYTGLFMQVEGVFGDIGRESYGSTVRDMTAAFGEPTIVFPKGLTPAQLTQQIRTNNIQIPELILNYKTPKGPMEARMFLLASLETPDTSVKDFTAKYNAATEQADLVVFSGHASYGKDVERFSKLGKTAAGQYQVFVLNACDSFAYEAPELRDAHLRANAAAANPAGFFDLVVNAMPAPAQEIPAVTLSFVTAFAEGKRSYKSILGTVNQEQRAVVLYDDDNLWGRSPAVPPVVPPAGGTARVVDAEGKFQLTGEQKQFGPFPAKGGFKASVTGTGDVDLYVRKGAAPTKSAYDCRPFGATATETCVNEGAGSFYVNVVNVRPASAFKLRVEYTE